MTGVIRVKGRAKVQVPLSSTVAVTICDEVIALIRHLHSSVNAWTTIINAFITDKLHLLLGLLSDSESEEWLVRDNLLSSRNTLV